MIEEEVDYLGPVAIAQFIDAGWLLQWPPTWSRHGLYALKNGFGRWTGSQQKLLYAVTEIPGGTANWPGRRAELPGN